MNCTVRRAACDAMVGHALAARPRECCGVLLGRGRGSTGGVASPAILEAVPAKNLAEDANRFLIDPKDHIDARRDGRARGLEVVGFYHSHPRSAAFPSPTDLADATYPDLLQLIVSLERETVDVRAFRLEHGNFEEIPLVTVP